MELRQSASEAERHLGRTSRSTLVTSSTTHQNISSCQRSLAGRCRRSIPSRWPRNAGRAFPRHIPHVNASACVLGASPGSDMSGPVPSAARYENGFPNSRAICISAATPTLSRQPGSVNTTTSSERTRNARSNCSQNFQLSGSPCKQIECEWAIGEKTTCPERIRLAAARQAAWNRCRRSVFAGCFCCRGGWLSNRLQLRWPRNFCGPQTHGRLSR